MKKCEICGGEFQGWMVISGKRRNLQRRRFCLDCSPFGEHNTSKIPATGSERVQLRKAVKRRCTLRRVRTVKRKLIEYLGSCCQRCGYDKPINAAYAFHHRDPKQKEKPTNAICCA